jgi:hypothetical protein
MLRSWSPAPGGDAELEELANAGVGRPSRHRVGERGELLGPAAVLMLGEVDEVELGLPGDNR